MTKQEIEKELQYLMEHHPEMLEEMSNGLGAAESPITARAASLGATLAAKMVTATSANSPLVSVTKLSPNYTVIPNRKVTRITPHHTAGVLSVESALEWFSKTSTRASCTYVIGNDGRVGLCVPEKHRPWTSSTGAGNDNMAITYEVCNSGWEKDGWPISDKSFETVVALSTDICRRYGKKKLLWIPDKEKALSYDLKDDEMLLTVHHWFSNTNCPGKYFENKFPELARRVTAALNDEEEEEMVRFQTVDECPKWAQNDMKKLIELGYLKGKDGGALDMTEDMVRTLIICGRMLWVL